MTLMKSNIATEALWHADNANETDHADNANETDQANEADEADEADDADQVLYCYRSSWYADNANETDHADDADEAGEAKQGKEAVGEAVYKAVWWCCPKSCLVRLSVKLFGESCEEAA